MRLATKVLNPTRHSGQSGYTPCCYCKLYYTHLGVARHWPRCKARPKPESSPMKRDWLDVNLIPGRQVRITIPTWRGPREGYLTGDSHLAGTAQVRRWTIRLPHNRTKTRTFDVSVEAHNFEVL